MPYLLKSLIFPKAIILYCLLALTFPVQAAVSVSLTPPALFLGCAGFITGLALAVMFFLFANREFVNKGQDLGKWYYPGLLLANTLVLLYFLLRFDSGSGQLYLVLLASVLLINLIYFISGKQALSPGNSGKKYFNKFSLILVVVADLGYCLVLFSLPLAWSVYGWLFIGGLIQVVAASAAGLSAAGQGNTKRFFALFAPQWLLTCAFVVLLYLWLTAVLPLPWLLASILVSFTLLLLNTCLVLSGLLKEGREEKLGGTKISSEDLFSYTHDPATNLPSYQQALKQFERILKQGTNQRFAAIVFKPVNFQQVNSVLGHHNSDLLLLQLAYCIQQKVLDNSALLNFDASHQPIRLARLQGLNFLVVVELAHSSHPEKIVIKDLCQQLSDAVPDAMSFKSFSLNFELAFGIAFAQGHETSAAELIAFAGDALLDAEQHQQSLSYFDNSTTLYTEQQLLKMERLKQDLMEENLRWYLQPQIALNDKSIKGFELMVHWYCEAEVAQDLHEFIDIAEQSGEIHLLMKNMILQAFQVLAQLQQLGIYRPLSLNIPSKDLLESELVDFIERQSGIFAIETKYLVIELTEEVMLSASTRTKAIIDQLKVLDIGIAIDQFSGSYESLRYLRKMAVNQVKIDCSRLDGQAENRADKAIINALINLTRNMGLPMIGLGIETPEVEQMFIAMGGEIAQGKVINRGVVPEELAIWLKRWYSQYPQAQGDKT
ncbi:GGDEF domain-containing phosphodiesterase [Thalassomonas haliotis]|uniref:EAL domain-containing protein n=1 Tax=Thalassomonas haliotis TaxID=485448 RepID=A0ABY7VD22_9GAMM|nr:GGDEF domain-containing phosphodiesterase [Thalassomonas haliotis]WDE11186.1 EAL domain-containing protein [Thalassomonas haliotis]